MKLLTLKIKPAGDRVLFRVHENRQDSNIILPEGSQVDPYGEVLEVGPDVKSIAVGDMILISPAKSAGLRQDGELLYVAHEPDIFAKYVKE